MTPSSASGVVFVAILAAAGVLLVAGQRLGPPRYQLAGLAFLIAAWLDWPDERSR